MFKSSDLLMNCPPVSGSGTGKIEKKESLGTVILFIHCLVSIVLSTMKYYHTETADGVMVPTCAGWWG